MKAFAARSANGEPRPCDLTSSDATIPPGVRSSKARYAIPEDGISGRRDIGILMSRALSAANPTPNSNAKINLYTQAVLTYLKLLPLQQIHRGRHIMHAEVLGQRRILPRHRLIHRVRHIPIRH